VTLRVLVAEDEDVARRGVVELVRKDGELEMVAECADGRSAVRSIFELAPDLALLDIKMPHLSGFDVIREVGPARMPPVIFLTAFDAFALQAFDANAVDYLLKPFTDARFDAAIAKAKLMIRLGEHHWLADRLADLLSYADRTQHALPATSPEFLAVRQGENTRLVAFGDIHWIEAARYYVRVYTQEGSYLIRDTIASLERRLDARQFFRISRSTIVNLAQVLELQPATHGDYWVVLRSGQTTRLTRQRRTQLESALAQRL
jgi:two-component system LytT family response regulator